mmetsp:Transcript_8228/g.29220  ORF Transcript_8228/g.29220 Transcript_8228/m.29220 type:complete len:380 (+) Transcript_8228:1199-2338(+)
MEGGCTRRELVVVGRSCITIMHLGQQWFCLHRVGRLSCNIRSPKSCYCCREDHDQRPSVCGLNHHMAGRLCTDSPQRPEQGQRIDHREQLQGKEQPNPQGRKQRQRRCQFGYLHIVRNGYDQHTNRSGSSQPGSIHHCSCRVDPPEELVHARAEVALAGSLHSTLSLSFSFSAGLAFFLVQRILLRWISLSGRFLSRGHGALFPSRLFELEQAHRSRRERRKGTYEQESTQHLRFSHEGELPSTLRRPSQDPVPSDGVHRFVSRLRLSDWHHLHHHTDQLQCENDPPYHERRSSRRDERLELGRHVGIAGTQSTVDRQGVHGDESRVSQPIGRFERLHVPSLPSFSSKARFRAVCLQHLSQTCGGSATRQHRHTCHTHA